MKIKILISLLFIYFFLLILQTSDQVRLWADDFCSSVFLRNNGYWQSQVMWWKSWTGRYSYIAFLDLVILFGLTGAKVLPFILFSLFSISSILIFGIPIALLFTIIFIANSPNIIQTFYWMTGSLNYFIPFVFLNFFLSLLILKYKKVFPHIGALLIFIASGFSEAFSIANILFLSLLFVVFRSNQKNKIIVFGLVANIISLVLMFLSPGNAERNAIVSHPSGFIDLITKTFVYSRWYLMHLFHIKTFTLSLGVIITGVFVFLNKKYTYFVYPRLVILLSIGFIVLVTLSVVGITYQAINWEPPERVMSIVNNMIIYFTVMFSVGIFQIFNKYINLKLAKVLFVCLTILLSYSIHLDWRKVYLELKDSAESTNYKAVGKLDGLNDNKGWVKLCIIEYYK